MKTITVSASKNYDVKIGAGLLPSLGAETAAVCKVGTAAIISDSTVWPLYGKAAKESLENAGYRVVSYVFPAGEASKCGATYLAILNFLAQSHVTRSDCVIALGGGVVGDISGFAAATFLRGVAYIQVPTTLLAAVDSSVGGKTAIDLEAGKNLAGAFYQPQLVLCDTDTLHSLPVDIFQDGCAEVIKYGVLYDPVLFAHLTEKGLDFDRESVIARCVELKRDVVMEDEFDTGARQKLNLGHTIGHGVEARSNFTVSHGKAVAIGMAIVCRAAVKYGICSAGTRDQIRETIQKFGLPCSTEHSAQELYESALSDKKRAGGTVNLVVPERIGSCILRPTPVEELKSFIEAGL
ncbi:MAG: 3-dehydroquinate synthase [Oscillospiraceae bacterium]|nr:3-dehydroquinate synthase [Oscillospiraceae bacterium]